MGFASKHCDVRMRTNIYYNEWDVIESFVSDIEAKADLLLLCYLNVEYAGINEWEWMRGLLDVVLRRISSKVPFIARRYVNWEEDCKDKWYKDKRDELCVRQSNK